MKQLKQALYGIGILFFFAAFLACGKNSGINSHLLVIAQQDSLRGIWDITAKDWLVRNNYQDIGIFKEGLALIKRDNKWGFADTTGKEVIAPVYDDAFAEGFIEGRAFVNINGKWGMIDKKGKRMPEPQFDEVYSYSNGFYSVKREELWNFISTDGKLLLPEWYTYVSSFNGGYASVQAQFYSEAYSDYDYVAFIVNKNGVTNRNDSLFGYIHSFGKGNAVATLRVNKQEVLIDTAGNILFKASHSPVYFNKEGSFGNGYIVFKTITSKYGLLNPRGQMVLDSIYDDIRGMSEGRVSFYTNGKWGIADSTGRIIIPPSFDDAVNFSEGLAAAYLKSKCGFIDKTGKWVVPPSFDNAVYFHNDFAHVTIGEKSGVINKSGKFMISCEYNFLSAVEANGCFSFKEDNNFGVIDTTGRELTKAQFESLEPVMKMKNGTMYRN